MDSYLLSAAIVLFFIFLGGLFAASELALVSVRESQLETLEKKGFRGKTVAKLARDPNTFLGAVQIGVTLSGFFSAAFGATALAPVLFPFLESLGLARSTVEIIAVLLLTLLIALPFAGFWRASSKEACDAETRSLIATGRTDDFYSGQSV